MHWIWDIIDNSISFYNTLLTGQIPVCYHDGAVEVVVVVADDTRASPVSLTSEMEQNNGKILGM